MGSWGRGRLRRISHVYVDVTDILLPSRSMIATVHLDIRAKRLKTQISVTKRKAYVVYSRLHHGNTTKLFVPEAVAEDVCPI
jgi:hypothetical protein